MRIQALQDSSVMRTALAEVAARGVVYIEDVLPRLFRGSLQYELEAGDFQPAPPSDHVSQEFEFYNLPYPTPAPSFVGDLGEQLTQGVQFHTDHPLLRFWEPNDIAVQRYLPDHGGIATHRDYKSDVLLVAIFTIAGAAKFRVWDGSKVRNEWLTHPGSLVLLRAPGLTEAKEDRPYHSIGKPVSGSRISLAYRLNRRLPTTAPLPR